MLDTSPSVSHIPRSPEDFIINPERRHNTKISEGVIEREKSHNSHQEDGKLLLNKRIRPQQDQKKFIHVISTAMQTTLQMVFKATKDKNYQKTNSSSIPFRSCKSFYSDASKIRTNTTFINLLGISTEHLHHNDVTMVSHLSVRRFSMIIKQLANWSGPISISLYVTTENFHSFWAAMRDTAYRDNIMLHLHVDTGVMKHMSM